MTEPKKMRVVELFSGIGATRAALTRVGKELGIQMEFVANCDIDKFTSKSYAAIFGDTNNLGDITKVEKLPECDFLTWSFPCTSLSKAGKCEGMVEGSGTASSLGWEVIRLLKAAENKPEWLLMENVPAVHNKRNKPEFDRLIAELTALGYNSVWHDMNAKYHGVAQNRNRCIMISRLKATVPEFGKPRDQPLNKVLRDYLEDPLNVTDESYYLSYEQVKRLVWKNEKNKVKKRGFNFVPRTEDAIAVAITTRSGQRETDNYIMCECVADLNREGWHDSADRVYSPDALCPTINTGQGGGHTVKVAIETDGPVKIINGSKQGWLEANDGDGIILGFYTGSQTARGRVQKGMCPTLQTGINAAVILREDNGKYCYIRTLTPRECWRLSGRTDDEIDKVIGIMSKSQMYKQAGNTIVVEVLEDAIRDVLKKGATKQCTLL